MGEQDILRFSPPSFFVMSYLFEMFPYTELQLLTIINKSETLRKSLYLTLAVHKIPYKTQFLITKTLSPWKNLINLISREFIQSLKKQSLEIKILSPSGNIFTEISSLTPVLLVLCIVHNP